MLGEDQLLVPQEQSNLPSTSLTSQLQGEENSQISENQDRRGLQADKLSVLSCETSTQASYMTVQGQIEILVLGASSTLFIT